MKIKDTITKHLGGIIDRSDKIVDIATNVGVAYYGYQVNQHWTGALAGLIGLKLAKSNSDVGAAAGVSTLTALGALQMMKPAFAQAQEAGRANPFLLNLANFIVTALGRG